MSTFKIFSDSSLDLPNSIIDKYNIHIIPFYVSFDNTSYLKEKFEIDNKSFYTRFLEPNTAPKTSLPSISDYADAFRPTLEAGDDLICMCISSKLSGSYQSACNAADILSDEFPERKIIIKDSLHATAGQGLIVLQCAYMKEAGFSLEDTSAKLDEIMPTSLVVFTVDNLIHLQRGGRIGKASALAGTLLNIKPIIKLSDGELLPISKVRGRKKALSEIIANTFNLIDNPDDYEFCLLQYGYPEDAMAIEDALKTQYNISITLPHFEIGCTIGTHVGPTATGLACIKHFNA